MGILLAVGGAALFATQKGVVKWAGLGLTSWVIYQTMSSGGRGGSQLSNCPTCTPPNW